MGTKFSCRINSTHCLLKHSVNGSCLQSGCYIFVFHSKCNASMSLCAPMCLSICKYTMEMKSGFTAKHLPLSFLFSWNRLSLNLEPIQFRLGSQWVPGILLFFVSLAPALSVGGDGPPSPPTLSRPSYEPCKARKQPAVMRKLAGGWRRYSVGW